MSFLDLFRKRIPASSCSMSMAKSSKEYNHFRDFLCHNRDALNLIAELEQTYYSGTPFSMGSVRRRYEELHADDRQSHSDAEQHFQRQIRETSRMPAIEINEEILRVFSPEAVSLP